MSYMLRDRPDGQVEIVLNNPILVGIFPERDTAQRVCAFLQADEPDLPVDEPANFAQAAADVRAVVEEVIAESAPEVPKFVRRHTKAFLPALIEEPKTPTVRKTATPPPEPDTRSGRSGIQADQRRRKDCRGRSQLRYRHGPVARTLGQQQAAGAKAPGRGWADRLRDLHEDVHPVDLQPRQMRAVQP